jgi:hypothetical protein
MEPVFLDDKLKEIFEKVKKNERLSFDDGLYLYETKDLILNIMAQILLAASIFKISPVFISGNVFYCMILAVCVVIAIMFNLNREFHIFKLTNSQ